MRFVDDIHPVFGGGRRKGRLLPQVPDVVHAVVAGGVDLHHVQNGAVVDPTADFAFVAGISLHRMQTVDRLGENLRTGGFSRAPRAGEQIGMSQPAGGDLIAQRHRNLRLTDHVLKDGRTPFAVQNLIHGVPPSCPDGKGSFYKNKTEKFSYIRACGRTG